MTITQTGTATAISSARTVQAEEMQVSTEGETLNRDFAFDVYPNPAKADNINLNLRGVEATPVQVRIIDGLGRELYNNTFENPSLATGTQFTLPKDTRAGVYVLMINQGTLQLRKKVVVNE